MSLKVGDSIYKKNYGNRFKGQEAWEKVIITSETSRSWVTGDRTWNQTKIAKKELQAGALQGYCITEQEMLERVYVEENAWRIAQACQGVRDYKTLKQIADAIGYKEKQS